MIEWIEKGGPLIWPILASGLVAILLVAERAFVFIVNLRLEERHRHLMTTALEQNDMAQAIRACGSARGLRLRIMRFFLEREVLHPGQLNLSTIQRDMNERIQNNAIPLLTARLGILSTLGRITPLMGLLGTVHGMIQMFIVVSNSGTGMSSQMAEGIGMALITTFVGLSIAIPVQLAEGIFESRIDAFIPRLQSDLSWVLNHIREQRFRRKVIRIRSEEL